MSQGRIENFGRPYDLIKDESTILHDLVYTLEKAEREKLIEMAKRSIEGSPSKLSNFQLNSTTIEENQQIIDINMENIEEIALLTKVD